MLFPFAEYWTFYLAFSAAVMLLLAADLGIFHRKAHAVGYKEALGWTAVWVALAMAFNYGLYLYCLGKFTPEIAKEVALEFLTGYVLEESLSVDNMFVFVVVFRYFGVPRELQHRVLFFGILGAFFFRAIFIAAGSALLQFQWTIYVFGGILLLTGIKMMFSGEAEIHPETNPLIRLFRRVMPVSRTMHGASFFVMEAGKRCATPLLICLLFLEMTDVLFAVDSVPAIFGVTSEPLIVFTSNIFAILGLRSLYFLLADAVHLFHLLQYGLSLVLVFVGLKMVWLNQLYGGHFPIVLSLGIILGIIGGSIALSILFPKKS
jgi:tellurite resistance protein TerC